MAVFDATALSAALTSSGSYTHTPVGTPRGVIALVIQAVNDEIQVTDGDITYGGVNVPLVHHEQRGSGEQSLVSLFFLGSGIPTGAQTVNVTFSTDLNINTRVRTYTVTGTGDTEVVDFDVVNAITADPSVTLDNPSGRECAVFAGLASGQDATTGHSEGPDYTSDGAFDPGLGTGRHEHRTSSSTATSIVADFIQTSDDACMIAVAVAEVAAGGVTVAPASADAASSVVAPTVILGSLSIAPAAASAAGAVVAPGVLAGSLSIAPSAAAAVGTVVAPTVDISGGGTAVAPAPVTAVGAVVAPTVRLGSITIAPTALAAVGTVVDPTIAVGGATIVAPDAASAKADVAMDEVLVGDGWKFGSQAPLAGVWTPQEKPPYSPYT